VKLDIPHLKALIAHGISLNECELAAAVPELIRVLEEVTIAGAVLTHQMDSAGRTIDHLRGVLFDLAGLIDEGLTNG